MSIHSQARSTEYHALQTKFQKRTSNGYSYFVSHTWSQTLTTLPAPALGGNFVYDTGPAGFDAPHLLAMSFGAELPFGRDKKFLSDAGPIAVASSAAGRRRASSTTAAAPVYADGVA